MRSECVLGSQAWCSMRDHASAQQSCIWWHALRLQVVGDVIEMSICDIESGHKALSRKGDQHVWMG